MTDTNVFKLARPGIFPDSLTEILRSGARALLTQAVGGRRLLTPAYRS
jgi:putative transposase